jgi:anti-sigma B factor antagonist
MNFNVTEQYGAAVITPSGRFLGSINGQEFRDLLDDLKSRGQKNVVVDLSKTDFMDSSAIGVMIAGLTTMRRDGGEIRLANLETRIKNLFVMTHLLGNVFESYESVEAAAQQARA